MLAGFELRTFYQTPTHYQVATAHSECSVALYSVLDSDTKGSAFDSCCHQTVIGQSEIADKSLLFYKFCVAVNIINTDNKCIQHQIVRN